MTRINGNLLIRLFAAVCGLVLAVAMTACGETGDLGQEDGATTSPTAEEGGGDEETRSPDADVDDGAETDDDDEGEPTEESTSDSAEDDGAAGEEPTSDVDDESDETEDPAQDFAEEGEETDSDDTEGDDPGAEATSESFSGSGMTASETVHLEGDYTVDFNVTDNALMDMESNFAADLISADDELDFHPLVNEIGTEVSGTTNVYGLDGDYYVDVMADGDWSFEFTPQ